MSLSLFHLPAKYSVFSSLFVPSAVNRALNHDKDQWKPWEGFVCVCVCVCVWVIERVTEWVYVCLFFLHDADQPLCHMVNWSFTLVKTNKSLFVPPHQFTAIGTAKIIRETVTFLCELLLSVVVWQNTWEKSHWCQKNMIVCLKGFCKTGGAVNIIVSNLSHLWAKTAADSITVLKQVVFKCVHKQHFLTLIKTGTFTCH